MVHNDRLSFAILCSLLRCLVLFSLATTSASVSQNPVPLINQPLVPDTIKPGGAGFTLTVNGTGFVSGSLVNWNASARATTFVSSSKLTATIAASDIATAKTASVTVVNPGPGGGTSNVAFFEVTPPTSLVRLAAASYATADRSYSVGVGDFNGDGKLDLAVADYVTSVISVLLGNGDGTFQSQVEYATGAWPMSVAVGDFNRDGKLDLAVANEGSDTISVLLGNGDGTFQAHVEYATENWPSGVTVADFNGDGKLDMAVAIYVANKVSVLLGNGDGTFQPAVSYSTGSAPGSVAVGDFNRDGKLDLAVANNGSDNVSILLGNGDGTFQPAVSYSTGSGATGVAVADFNADGKLDLAVSSPGGVSVLLGNGDGTFQTHVDYGTGSSNNSSVAVGDFNGDGKLDLVVADLFSMDVRLLLGNGDGTFGTAASYGAGSQPSSVALGDFNDDGGLDIAVADADSATVSVLLQYTSVSLSKTGLTFADQVIHTSGAHQNVTLTNVGPLALSIYTIAITGADANDFSQTHTCGLSIPPRGSCTITLTFTPTLIGPRKASITITDNAEGNQQMIPLTGTGVVSGPNATLSTSGLTFATQPVSIPSPAQTFTLGNYGTATLTINRINLTGADPGDFEQTNTCGGSVDPGGNCTISAIFKPTQTGPRMAGVTITDNALGSPQTVSLKGAGTIVELNPTSLSFGKQTVGTTTTQSTTITNVASTALSIAGIAIAGKDPDEFGQTNTCGTSVGAGTSCTIAVTFTPTAGGDDSAEVSISDNGGGSPQTVALSGSGLLASGPNATLSSTTLTFATQLVGTSSQAQTVTLSNYGTATLAINSINLTGADPGDFAQTNTCGGSVGSGGNCTISVIFKPTQTGPRMAGVTITDNAPGSPQAVAISGTGLASGPNATLSSTSLAFATQLVGTPSPAQTLTLGNYGTATLTINSINVTGADPGDFEQTNTCGGLVGSGGNCTISVIFKPTQTGPRMAGITVTDSAPGSPQTVSLKGTGTVVELNPTSLSFGKQQVGTTTTQSTTLTNVGSTALSIAGIAIAGTDTDEFSQTHTCGTSVGAGKSCTITVTFTPTEKGSDSAEVSINDNGGGSPQQVSLSGSGCVWEIINRHRKCVTTVSATVQAKLAKSRSAAVPSVTGVNRVGTRVIDLLDSSRIDPFATDGLKRELLVRFWYPTSAKQDCKPADYTSRRVWNYFAELTRLPLPAVTTNSCLNAPVAEGEYPVVVFTHGYTGTFTDYTFLVEDLASRGYIVASIDHTYEATAVEFPDERFVKSLVGSHLTNTWHTDDQTLTSALSLRLDDVKFVVDELERLNVSTGNPFTGKLNVTRLALAGHSLGGLTTWFGVQRDARFKAAILLDPYLPDMSLGSTETPVMLLTMGREQQNEDECQLWSALRGPRLAVNLQGAEHVTPSDLVWLAKGAVKTGPMGPDKTIAAIRDYVASFLDTNLLGKPPDHLLTGSSTDYLGASIITRDESLCGASTGK